MEEIVDVWPDGLPRDYWRFDAVGLADDDNVIRFIGIQFEWEFVVATIVGAVLIWLFARSSFEKPSFEPSSFKYRVLAKLSPSDLRGHSQVRRAYALYAGTLILIYGSLTFFGKLILDLFNPVLNTAGLSFNAGGLDFASPQWPITICFGMIGLIPMLKPVELLERAIRRVAHERAGIPVHMHQRSADIRKEIDNLVEGATEARLEEVPAWVHQSVNDPRSLRRSVEALEQLALLRNWLMDEHSHWPDAEQRQRIGRLEAIELEESGVVLEELWALMAQNFDESRTPTPEMAHLTEDQRLLAHRNQLISKWRTLTASVERHRDELIAILVVYAERDDNYANIEDPRLEALIKKIFVREAAPPGPEWGILWCLLPIFVVYFVAVWGQRHPELGSLPPDAPRIAAYLWTAFLETARVACLFWLPVAAVLAIRTAKWEATERAWEQLTVSAWTVKMQLQLAKSVGWAMLPSLGGLCLLAILWAALVSRHPDRFAYLLFSAPIPIFWANVTLVVIAVVQVVVVLMVTDAREESLLWRFRWLVGLTSAALVLLCKIVHFLFWLHAANFAAESQTDLILIRNVILPNDIVNLAVYGILAAASVTILMPRRAAVETVPPVKIRDQLPATTTAACLGVAIALAGGAEAQSSREIRVGFRADAEPFSFRIDRNGENRYSGYIADLCYKIFASDAYSVDAVEVTADDRFQKLKSGEIDLLCDPVTLRYSRNDGRAEGIFSPIVFVSGVSYLWRQTTVARPPELLIAFVKGTSAAEVAYKACESDHFRWQNTTREYDVLNDCRVREAADCWIGGKEPISSNFSATYRVCAAENHQQIISWFCSDVPDRGYSKAYFGDQDIIRGKLEAWNKAGGECQDVEQHRDVYTYEPYALVISRDPEHIDLVDHVQRRIYEIFSNRPEAVGLFVAHFPGKKMSLPLANLFLLNAVERPECLQFRQGPRCAPANGNDVLFGGTSRGD